MIRIEYRTGRGGSTRRLHHKYSERCSNIFPLLRTSGPWDYRMGSASQSIFDGGEIGSTGWDR